MGHRIRMVQEILNFPGLESHGSNDTFDVGFSLGFEVSAPESSRSKSARNVSTWHLANSLSGLAACPLLGGLCCKTPCRQALVRFWECQGACFACRVSRDRRQRFDIRRLLGIRSTGGWRHRWRSPDILGEFSQVLGGGDEQNLVTGATQAP
jgi:hypothetical protein